jgi:hypothetical protein
MGILRRLTIKGRNLAGRVGLFPVTYTTPAPPSSQSVPDTLSHHTQDSHDDSSYGRPSFDSSGYGGPSALESIHEHDEPPPSSTASNATSNINGTNLTAAAPEPARLDSDRSLYPDSARDEEPSPRSEDGGRMMRATLTDVQQAIEQLGARGRLADDGARSFSFASSRSAVSASDASETEGEGDEDEFGTEYGDEDDQGWHKDARTKLAEKARRAAEREQRQREREEARATLGPRTIAPPIEVELSDESEPEEDDTRHPAGPPGSGIGAGSSAFHNRTHSDIKEESEDGSIRAGITGRRVESPEPTATATRATFDLPTVAAPGATIYPPPNDPRAQRLSFIYPPQEEEPVPEEPEEESQSLPTPVSPAFPLPAEEPVPLAVPTSTVAFTAAPAAPVPIPVVSAPVPEPAQPPPQQAAAPTVFQARDMLPSPASSSPQPKLAGVTAMPAPIVAPVTPPPPGSPSGGDSGQIRSKTHPSEWTVDEVVDWLRSKGFDQAVCDVFIEQEITGDVLLEIDQNVLKTEFGIAAFGKRVRIANAISDLKRPASFSYSEPGSGGSDGLGPLLPLRPFPASAGVGGVFGAHHPAPIQVPAPGMGLGGNLQTPASHHSSAVASLRSDSPLRTGGTGGMGGAEMSVPPSATASSFNHHRRNVSDVSGSVASSVRWASLGDTTVDGTTTSDGASYLGLGFAPGKGPQGLALSPSEGALSARAVSEAKIPEEPEEDRAAMSEVRNIWAVRLRGGDVVWLTDAGRARSSFRRRRASAGSSSGARSRATPKSAGTTSRPRPRRPSPKAAGACPARGRRRAASGAGTARRRARTSTGSRIG